MKLTANGLTGQELMDFLTEINFKVPVKTLMPVKDYPVYIYPPKRTGNNDTDRANMVEYRDYMNERARLMQEYLNSKAEYYKQFTDFAGFLSTIFERVPEDYTWLQISERLIGKYGKPISNPIYFISFKKF